MSFQQFRHLSSILAWIFVCLVPSGQSAIAAPQLSLVRTVFIALRGERFTLHYVLEKPANQSVSILKCFDPSQKSFDITVVRKDNSTKISDKFVLENVTLSGEYHCEYANARAYWFLRVRDEGYKDMLIWDYTELTVVAIFTGMLLVFSAGGSVYVFKEHWNKLVPNNKGPPKKQSKQKTHGENDMEHTADVTAAPSTSFYASLDPGNRSFYDVLEPKERKTAPSSENLMVQTTQPQDETAMESVYENF